MSTSLVRKALEIVDPGSFTITEISSDYKMIMKEEVKTCNSEENILPSSFLDQRRKSKKKQVFGLVPENQKYIAKKPGKNANKINLLSANSKLTVTEARKKYKSKEQILKDNLKKLEIIKRASKVNLDKATVNQIVQRAVTRRPVNKLNTPKKKKEKKTAFTEEDFRKFEADYLDE